MMTPHWRLRFLKIAELVASFSKDPSTKCGAIIVTPDRRRIQIGYNGPPGKLRDSKWQTGTRERRLAATIHAEINAITLTSFETDGCWLFIFGLFPCTGCADLIVQAGISTVVCYREHMDAKRWNPEEAMEILKDGGVNVVVHNLKEKGIIYLTPLRNLLYLEHKGTQI